MAFSGCLRSTFTLMTKGYLRGYRAASCKALLGFAVEREMRSILHGSLLQQPKDHEKEYWRNYDQHPQK